ncbi:diguanylate cyclase [Zoogloea dura]|uniref:diguanylate cyclase n=1 Tax=Zoogloea dura TaxID=2728840 RepID=A0A848G359_9RHOO|nr:diguanylate cyclase [Zoogloea dura]NML25662.1 diguanylate cyclase [Zoogloea dura]
MPPPLTLPPDLDCAALLDSLPVALALVNGENGQFVCANQAFLQHFGQPSGPFDTWWSHTHHIEGTDSADPGPALQMLAGSEEGVESDILGSDGRRHHMRTRLRSHGRYLLVCLIDLSDGNAHQEILRQALAEMETRSTTDALTGLPTRRRLEEAALSEMHRFRRFGHPISLIMADIDHFKRINDSLGHLVGDQVLVEFAQRLSKRCRDLDVIGRYGGEEFVILLPSTPLAGATTLANTLRQTICDTPFDTAGPVSASFGVAECLAGDDWPNWLSRADQALYQAKDAGRNRVMSAPESAFDERAIKHRSRLDRLTWDDGHCVGDPVIDAQHHHLFELANRLLHQVREARPPAEIHAVIRDLARATSRHFRDEEAILTSVDYPRREQHAKAHRILSAKLDALSTQSAHGSLPTSKLIEFLAYDLVDHHALGADRDFIPWLRRIPRDTPPPSDA